MRVELRHRCPVGLFFPNGFQNSQYWSNEKETLKLIDEVINPYVIKKRKDLGLALTQKALVIWDVFKGQMSDTVKNKLESLEILLVPVPVNMAHFFQPLISCEWSC